MIFNQRQDIINNVKEEFGNIRPRRDNWIILLHDEIVREKETGTDGILLISQHADSIKYRVATVVGVGKNVSLEEGDRVVISKYINTQIPHPWSGVCAMVLASEDQVDAKYVE